MLAKTLDELDRRDERLQCLGHELKPLRELWAQRDIPEGQQFQLLVELARLGVVTMTQEGVKVHAKGAPDLTAAPGKPSGKRVLGRPARDKRPRLNSQQPWTKSMRCVRQGAVHRRVALPIRAWAGPVTNGHRMRTG